MELKTKTIQNIDEDDTEDLSQVRGSKTTPIESSMRANLKAVGGSS